MIYAPSEVYQCSYPGKRSIVSPNLQHCEQDEIPSSCKFRSCCRCPSRTGYTSSSGTRTTPSRRTTAGSKPGCSRCADVSGLGPPRPSLPGTHSCKTCASATTEPPPTTDDDRLRFAFEQLSQAIQRTAFAAQRCPDPSMQQSQRCCQEPASLASGVSAVMLSSFEI